MAVIPSSTVRIRSGGMQRAIHCGLEDRGRICRLINDIFWIHFWICQYKIWNVPDKVQLTRQRWMMKLMVNSAIWCPNPCYVILLLCTSCMIVVCDCGIDYRCHITKIHVGVYTLYQWSPSRSGTAEGGCPGSCKAGEWRRPRPSSAPSPCMAVWLL